MLRQITTLGEIMWSKPVGSGVIGLGLKSLNIDVKDILINGASNMPYQPLVRRLKPLLARGGS